MENSQKDGMIQSRLTKRREARSPFALNIQGIIDRGHPRDVKIDGERHAPVIEGAMKPATKMMKGMGHSYHLNNNSTSVRTKGQAQRFLQCRIFKYNEVNVDRIRIIVTQTNKPLPSYRRSTRITRSSP